MVLLQCYPVLVSTFMSDVKNCDEKHCGLHDIMKQVRDATLAILENRTLADLKD